VVALAACLIAMLEPTTLRAQETSSKIFGWAPAGQTVTVKGSTGAHRHVTVADNGRYTIGRLPLGTYTVTLVKEGKDVDVRHRIGLQVGRGAEVDFACPGDHCERVPEAR
jgi:surface antigen